MHHGRVHARPPVNRDFSYSSTAKWAIFFPSSSYSGFGKGENIYFYETLQEYQLSIVMTIHNGYVFKVYFPFFKNIKVNPRVKYIISALKEKRKEYL